MCWKDLQIAPEYPAERVGCVLQPIVVETASPGGRFFAVPKEHIIKLYRAFISSSH